MNDLLLEERRKKQPSGSQEEMIAIDGRRQVLEMLRVADPFFREKILKQIAERDPRLAYQLRQDL